MRLGLVPLAVAYTLQHVYASPSKPCAHKVKETVVPPFLWSKAGAPAPDHTIHLRIGLTQPNFHVLENHLMEVSDPYHERYGQHLSKEEVEEIIAPHDESLELVNEWLYYHGLGEEDLVRSPAKDWVTIKVNISLAEKMLDTKYDIWQHSHSGDTMVRTTSYSLPENLHDHIDVVQPTTIFAQWKGMRSNIIFPDGDEFETDADASFKTSNVALAGSGVDGVDPSCNTTVTLTCLKQLYNAVGYVPKATKKNSIGTTGYLEQFANLEDLRLFYEDQLPEAVNSTFKFISVKGGLNDQNISNAGAEADLDVQFAFGLSYPTPGTFWSTAGRPPFIPDLITPENTNEPYADWLDYVLSHKDTPYVISTSYGEPEQTIPLSYAHRVCAGFAQLGARGVTLAFASGDGGVGDGDDNPETQICKTNDGRNATRFMPIFPSTCPYVTSVGGTEFVPEVAVFFSGGGFSDRWERPRYQKKAVEGFLKKLPEGLYDGLFDRGGRAIPDVAALGRRYRIFFRGSPVSIGGTSASTPTFSAIVALLNDARLAKGLPTLGFINPLLYSDAVAETFNDITSGNNPGCGTPGFNATTGWDPITGLGTPNFYKLLDLVT